MHINLHVLDVANWARENRFRILFKDFVVSRGTTIAVRSRSVSSGKYLRSFHSNFETRKGESIDNEMKKIHKLRIDILAASTTA